MRDPIAVTRRSHGAAALLALLSACAGAPMDEGPAQPRENHAVWVVEGAEMRAGETVLEGLRTRRPSMQVRRTERCPELVIRGRSSIEGSSAPLVYVDGQRAADVCILSLMRAAEVSRVEIYPAGQTQRPGYFSNGTGLVLVFTLDGSAEA